MRRSSGSKCNALSSLSFAQPGFSHFRPKLCGCGKRLLLLKSSITRNNGIFFGDVEIGQ